MFNNLFADLRSATRTLARNPGFTTVTVLTCRALCVNPVEALRHE